MIFASFLAIEVARKAVGLVGAAAPSRLVYKVVVSHMIESYYGFLNYSLQIYELKKSRVEEHTEGGRELERLVLVLSELPWRS